MVLTTGQTYFYILCQTALIGYVCHLIFNIIRIKMINDGPCKKLKETQKEITEVRRLAMLAYQKASVKNGGQ